MGIPHPSAETGRLIMPYVRELESKVFKLRRELGFRQWRYFVFGVALGAAGSVATFLAMRYL